MNCPRSAHLRVGVTAGKSFDELWTNPIVGSTIARSSSFRDQEGYPLVKLAKLDVVAGDWLVAPALPWNRHGQHKG